MPRKTKVTRYYEAVGRRREAVARVRLYLLGKDKTTTVFGIKGKAGDIFVNKKPIDSMFPALYEKIQYLKPLKLTDNENRFVISVLIKGGGKRGQLEAIIHGMAKALDKVDKESFHLILKKEKLLTRDSRIRERRKVGTGGKARRQKQSPKR